MNNDIISQVRCEQPPLETILSPKQCRYYRAYFKDGKRMSEIANESGVEISTVCRVIKSARQRLLQYYKEGADNG